MAAEGYPLRRVVISADGENPVRYGRDPCEKIVKKAHCLRRRHRLIIYIPRYNDEIRLFYSYNTAYLMQYILLILYE